MKSIRIPLLVLFLCMSLAASYSQDTATDSSLDKSGSTGIQQEVTGTSGSGDISGAAGNGTSDSTGESAKENTAKKQSEKKSGSDRKTAVSREKEATGTATENNTSAGQGDAASGVLLQINEGNFKYKRIPDIKLPETQVQVAEAQADNTSGQAGNSGSGGFLGMSKTTSDIVVYGGIIIFIYIVFFLSRSRMKGSGGRKSNRKVLNSYRK